MDKVRLTKEQLKELKRFINSRGFREPLIVMEILDHFACLVEEKLQEDPAIGLTEAMQQAHGSFGVMGFKPIADAADMERNKRLNRQFNKTLRNMMQSPKIWLLLVLAGTLYYQVYSWLRVEYVDADNAGLIMFWPSMLIYLIGKIVIMKRFKQIGDRYVSGKDTGTVTDRWYAGIAFMVVALLNICPADYWAYPVIVTVYILAILVFIIAMYRTWQATEQYYSDVEQLHTELDTQ